MFVIDNHTYYFYLKKLLLSFFYLLNCYRRKIECYYNKILPGLLIYLGDKKIKLLSLVISFFFLCMSIVPLIFLLILSTNKLLYPLVIVVFWKIFITGNKISVFKFSHPESFYSLKIKRATSSNIYKILSVVTVLDILFFLLTIVFFLSRTIIFMSISDLFMLLSIVISIYFMMEGKQEHIYLILCITIVSLSIFIKNHMLNIPDAVNMNKYLLYLNVNAEAFLPVFTGIVIISAVLIFVIDILYSRQSLSITKKFHFGLDRGYTSFINYVKTLPATKKLMIFFPSDLLVIILILTLWNYSEKQAVFPMIACSFAILSTKQFLNQYAYFFHFFVNERERISFEKIQKNNLKIFTWKIKLLLYAKSLYMSTIFFSYYFSFNNITLKDSVFLAICVFLGVILPVLDEKLVIVTWKTVSIVGEIKYSINFDALIIMVLVLCGAIVDQIIRTGNSIYLDYFYLFTALLLIVLTCFKMCLLTINLKMRRKLYDHI